MVARTAIAVLACVANIWAPSAVRVDMEALDLTMNAPDPAEVFENLSACVEMLRPVLLQVSYRQLFSPILNGQYRLRNKGTGLYLQQGAGGDVEMSSDKDSKVTRWRLAVKRNLQSDQMPTYSLKNIRGGGFLVTDNNQIHTLSRGGQEIDWHLTLTEEGDSYYIVNKASGMYLGHAGNPGGLDDTTGSAPAAVSSHSLSEEWELVQYGNKLGGWFLKRQYKTQWRNVVQDLPILPGHGSRTTWGKLCRERQCADFYVVERERMVALQRIQENKRGVVAENKVRSLCDAKIPMLKDLVNDQDLIWEMFSSQTGQGCNTRRLSEFGAATAHALEEECFNSCLGALAPLIEESGSCEDGASNWSSIWDQAIASNTQCAELPADSLEALARWQMEKKCWEWYPPSLLWVPKDDAPQALEFYDHLSACRVDPSRPDSPVDRVGVCPSGTVCECPKTSLNNKRTTPDRRGPSPMFFVPSGSATEPSLATQQERTVRTKTQDNPTMKFLVSGAVGAGVGAVAAAGAALALPGLAFGAAAGLIVSATTGHAKWSCEMATGCWPVDPVSTRTSEAPQACRYPEEARNGGSAVWFLPPPMFQLRHNGWGCNLETCSAQDSREQKLGLHRDEGAGDKLFGKPNVYNCQMLKFEDMSADQKWKFLTALEASGVSREYNISGLIKTHRPVA